VADDPYSRVDYRRLVAWPERIEREWPFLSAALGSGGRVLDLGSGTGEHSRFLASKGYDTVGVDSSPAMLAKATDSPTPPNLTFVEGDMTRVADVVSGSFDGAICLGNALPHVADDDSLSRMFDGLRGRLRPGAPFVLQVLNYDKVLDSNQRALPVNVRKGDDGEEIVFLRLMTPRPGGMVIFTPSTLRFRADADPALEVVSTRSVLLKGWRRAELEARLEAAGFTSRRVFGTMADVPWNAAQSPDTVIVAR
jgi:SAM-dependent methyltransferase